MRWFGYKDTSIFFLPFFGAAATGRKDDATISEKFGVLLGGPLPGLIVGIVIALILHGKADRHSWEFQVVSLLIAINYLNLLPILPLDGGRIVNMLLFSRHPYTDVLFKVVTVCILLLVSLVSGDRISLIIGIFVSLTIVNSWRSAKVLQSLNQLSNKFEDRTQLLQAIYSNLRQLGYDSLSFAQKYNLVKDVAQRYGEADATWTMRLSLLALYLVCLLSGLFLSGVALISFATSG